MSKSNLPPSQPMDADGGASSEAREEIKAAIKFYEARGSDWLGVVTFIGIKALFGGWHRLCEQLRPRHRASHSGFEIVAAAVRCRDRIYGGLRHGCIMQDIWEEFPGTKILQEDQGFLTRDGRFLNRFQAGAAAFQSGQTATRKEHLYSEDLW